MIAKVGSSTNIKGTIDYLENNTERVEWKTTQHLASDEKEFVVRQMELTAEMSRTDQPIYHYSISWDVDDNPTRKQMEAVARQTLNDLGLRDHHALIIAHNDHDYQHVHIMANRVHPETGLAWNRRLDYVKLEKSLRRQERAYGWREVPGLNHRLEDQQKPEYSQSLNRVEAAYAKEGVLPLYMRVEKEAAQDFRNAKSWGELHNRLAEKGYTIQPGSRGTGGKITDGYTYANLSKIHRDFSMGKLEKRFGKFKSLDKIRESKGLSHTQKLFSTLEKAVRLKQPKEVQNKLKKSLLKTFKGLGKVKKVHNSVDRLLLITTPVNPAFKIAKGIAGKVIKLLKQQSQSIERGR